MTASDDLLRRIENDPVLAGLLAWPGDFDIGRRDPVEDLRLPTGMPLHPVAGCGGGGTYFLCGAPGAPHRPVLYADSEGQAALIAEDLVEAVRLVAVPPYWRDAGAGHPLDELEEEMREDHPDIGGLRGRLAAALGIPLPSAEEALARLRAAAAGTAPDFVPVAAGTDGAEPCEPLFGDRV
ncbi:hypothetical protein GCM10010420_34970 [Streptomyces glaucosporus]|uniref:SUKH-4 immunity protein of toxin-antitoxin system n=1 Tax=Streptomyces glaucosporus TaxID=284044 RepID=A0ABN3IIU9_9ACTN